MTENEAIEILEERYLTMSMCGDIKQCKRNNQAISSAVTALTEIQQYRAIGTVEECREARERQMWKKPALYGDFEDGKLLCPNCEEDLMDLAECGFNCCPYCGQAIDWSE